MGSLQALVTRLQALQVPHCTAVNASTRKCTRTETWDGVKVVAELARAAIDPTRAQAAGLKDRRGNATHLRQDGVTREQVTPVSLLVDSISAVDDAFDQYAAEHPNAPNPREAWKDASSRLADQFLGVQGQGASSTFSNPLVTRLLPPALDQLRAELYARCPDSWTHPYARCTWVRDELPQELQDALGSPLFATAWDFLEAARRDPSLRAQVDGLANYLLDSSDSAEAWPALLGTAVDAVQLLAAEPQKRGS
jgi:hypothetical protein